MAQNSPAQALNNLLVTHDFDVTALDAKTGRPPVNDAGQSDLNKASMFLFDYKGKSGKNYGTVEILVGPNNNMVVGSGDNTGRAIDDPEDKADWFEFLQQLKQFAVRNNFMGFEIQNINRLKYLKQTMAQVTESFHGNRKYSFSAEPTQARLMIKHNRDIREGDARFRNIESLFIETADGERYRLGFKNLTCGRAMLEHVKQGGKPYDIRGQHIAYMYEQISILGQFHRAHQGKLFEGDAQQLIAETENYFKNLRRNLKSMSTKTGYKKYFESWQPEQITEQDLVIEDLRDLFVETRIDPRIEQALPMLAKIREGSKMKEADIFEQWANTIVEGTWALPDTPEQQAELERLMSKELPAGPDGGNATEQLYNVLGDDKLFDEIQALAKQDPGANIWDSQGVQDRMAELGFSFAQPIEPEEKPLQGVDGGVDEAENMSTFESVDELSILKSLALRK